MRPAAAAAAAVVFWHSLLWLAVVGCGGVAQSDEDGHDDQPPPGGNDTEVERKLPQAVVALHVTTSFVDRGVKGIIFPDGTTLTWRGGFRQPGKEPVVRRLQLSPAQRDRVVREFQQHDFFKLPLSMRTNVTDGSNRIVGYGDRKREHVVFNYMTRNADFDGVQQPLEKLLEEKLNAGKGEKLTAAEMVQAVAEASEKLPRDAPSRTTARQWLDLTVRGLSGKLDPELVQKYQLPGDGAAIYRRVRSR